MRACLFLSFSFYIIQTFNYYFVRKYSKKIGIRIYKIEWIIIFYIFQYSKTKPI